MPFKLQFIVKGDKALLQVVWKQFDSHITGDILVRHLTEERVVESQSQN